MDLVTDKGKNGGETTTITITATMKDRWVPHFLSMLRYMERCGAVGSSRTVGIYADGDGDFRPKFEWDPKFADYENEEPVENENGNHLYDAG